MNYYRLPLLYTQHLGSLHHSNGKSFRFEKNHFFLLKVMERSPDFMNTLEANFFPFSPNF